jgi:AcrR family transcriptional regulator
MDSVHFASRRRGAPPAGQRLTRDDVVTQAATMIARDGLAGFSLRGLAESLGVTPSAVYNHTASRDDLLDAVTDRFVAGIRLPAGQQPWPDWARAVAARLRSQLIEQPGVTELLLARAGSTAAGPGTLTRFLDRLVSSGVDRAVAHVAWHALLTVVVGSVAQERARGVQREATFQAVIDITMTGLIAAARQPPSPQAIALLDAHLPSPEADQRQLTPRQINADRSLPGSQ